MNSWTLLRRSLVHYRRTHLWVLLGTMVSTAILTGALILSDSVRYSLERIVRSRLGNAEFALAMEDRFFRAGLADRLAWALRTDAAPVLRTRGVAVLSGGRRRVNRVEILGVDGRFGRLGNCPEEYSRLAPGEVLINRALGERLQARAGEEILLRMEKPAFFPKDAPLAPDQDLAYVGRYKVKGIVGDEQWGRFQLQANQVASCTAFLPLEGLGRDLELEERANLLLLSVRRGEPLTGEEIGKALRTVWSLEDTDLEAVPAPEAGRLEIRSRRIFLDPAVSAAAAKIDPSSQPVLTYLVNRIRKGERSAPYSFVSGAASPLVPGELRDHEILINEWLAEDLGARAGDDIRLAYFVVGSTRALEEAVSEFRVKAVVPLQGAFADRRLMPALPGLAEKESCREWDPGTILDLSLIRDKDEDYWNRYRGTPKAFVSLAAARKMWANRFGDATAVRLSGGPPEELVGRMTSLLDPAGMGLTFQEVRRQGLAASRASVDFGGLFIGLSFFIILAGLLLTALLFVLQTEQRAAESALLRALGFSAAEVRARHLREGLVLAAAGGLTGALAGVLYNQAVLWALRTVWQGAVGTSALHLHLRLPALAAGAGLGALTAFLAMVLTARRQLQSPVPGLLRGERFLPHSPKRSGFLAFVTACFCLAAAAWILYRADWRRPDESFLFFFLAGAMALAGGIAVADAWLARLQAHGRGSSFRPAFLGIRNLARRRFRSLGLIGMLSSGMFLVFTVGAHRQGERTDAARRSSGTGGFALVGETTLPLLYDLNSSKGRQFYQLEREAGPAVRFVPFRVQEGDDASCLNLNRVSRPRLLGVNPRELAERKSFSFVETLPSLQGQDTWMALDEIPADGPVPALADQTVLTWGLGKAVGDTLEYVAEDGRPFRIRLVAGLANSVFQGSLIVSEKALLRYFPSHSGHRFFLADVPPDQVGGLTERLSWALSDLGLDVVPAAARLADFNQVQNTYLSIFLILGSFGLILGSVGMGIVVQRNVLERRHELAVLLAMGFRKREVRSLVVREHLALWGVGLAVGAVSSGMVILPSLAAGNAEVSWGLLLLLMALVAGGGLLWIALSAAWATQKDLVPALRRE